MEQAFELAGLTIPEGVTHMMGQSSISQVPNLIRVFNNQRTELKDKLKKTW